MKDLILPFFAMVCCMCSCSNEQVEEVSRINSVRLDSLAINPEEDIEANDILHKVCEQTQLSTQFDILVDFRCIPLEDLVDSCMATIIVKDKSATKHFDTITVTSNFYYLTQVSFNCDSMLSYTNIYNADRLEMDNYLGDVIIADFNFDNKDDVAVVNAMSNSGAFYSYFIQSPDNKFVFNAYLTDSMSYFPKIIKSKKELVTYVIAGACCYVEYHYRYLPRTKEWKEVSYQRHCGC